MANKYFETKYSAQGISGVANQYLWIFWRKNSGQRIFWGNISAKKVGLRYSQRISFLREKTWKKKGIFWRNSSAQTIFHINSAKRKGWIMIKPKNIILKKKNFEKKYILEKIWCTKNILKRGVSRGAASIDRSSPVGAASPLWTQGGEHKEVNTRRRKSLDLFFI